MRTKLISLSIALLMGVSVWADDVWHCNIYDECSRNGQTINIENGHELIDLGLPSGIKWATYKYANGAENKLTKYCNDVNYGDNGFTDNKTTLELEDDAAHVNWGGNWRMPTDAEWNELLNNCIWSSIPYTGYQVTSKTHSDSIFLPAAGPGIYVDEDYFCYGGYYWTSSLTIGSQNHAWNLYHNPVNKGKEEHARYEGLSVRPVSTSPVLNTLTLYADNCESSNVIKCNSAGQQVNVTAVPAHEHRHFVRWPDGNTDNPRLVTVTQDMTLTAEFADDPILTLVSSNYSWGRLYGEGQFKPNTSCQIYAIPYHGYHFVQWNDGNTDNPRTIVLTCDTTFTAEFAQTFSGQCGKNLYWKYEGHTLNITGSGNMYDYISYDYDEYYVPWFLFRDTTDAVVLEQGITHIGNNAFNGFVKVGKIELPRTLTSIGANAFAGCRKLYDIYAYPTEPPVADNTSFANYNVNLYVPCANLRDYQMDAVFGSFKYIQCMGTTDTEQVSVDVATDHAAQKVFRDGQVYILRGGKTYTIMGYDLPNLSN